MFDTSEKFDSFIDGLMANGFEKWETNGKWGYFRKSRRDDDVTISITVMESHIDIEVYQQLDVDSFETLFLYKFNPQQTKFGWNGMVENAIVDESTGFAFCVV